MEEQTVQTQVVLANIKQAADQVGISVNVKGPGKYLIKFGIPRRWKNSYKKFAHVSQFEDLAGNLLQIQDVGGKVFSVE